MHDSAKANMAACVTTYLSPDRHYRVVDFGSRVSSGQTSTHRDLFSGLDVEYVGVDIERGKNVDVVMKRPYRVPLPTSSVDIVVSGQVFEHIPFPWASFMELARILRPGGLIFLTVPSRGHTHDVYDCWRIYPDGLRALAAVSRMELLEGRTDFPPTTDGRRFDYGAIDAANSYWGDTVGVFRKPSDYPDRETWLFRTVAVWWANRVGGLAHVPGTDPRHPGRRVEPPPSPVQGSRPGRDVVLGMLLGPVRKAGRRALRRARRRARRVLGSSGRAPR